MFKLRPARAVADVEKAVVTAVENATAPDADLEREARHHTNLGTDYRFARHRPKHRFADPAPLAAVLCFGTTIFLLSLLNVNARHVHTSNVIVGLGFFMGGLGQYIAGIFEFIIGNTYSMVTFIGYGSMWATLGLTTSKWSGIQDAYETESEFNQALGLLFIAFFCFTFVIAVASAGTFVLYLVTVGLADLTLLVLGIGHLYESQTINKAGGYIGLVCAATAYYSGAAALFREVGLVALPNPEFVYNRT